MLGSFLITLREGVEAALIVGILLSYLSKTKQSRYNSYVYYGVLAAMLISGFAAYLFTFFLGGFTGRFAKFFEGSVIFLAVVVLTYMVVWMHHQARTVSMELKKKADAAIESKNLWALSTLSFIAVFREGVETVLFLYALFIQQAADNGAGSANYLSSIFGAFGGIITAIILAFIFFKGFGHVNLKTFFRITGIIIIVIAAGLLAYGVHEFEEAGILPPIIKNIWDINHILDEKGTAGSFLKALFGYNGNPSLLEVTAYVLYYPLVFWMLKKEHHDLAQ
jgi:high-affinity iron transporter